MAPTGPTCQSHDNPRPALPPDGGLYATSGGANKLCRFTTNGAVDGTFTATNPGSIYTIAAQLDGKVLVADLTNPVRLNLNGQRDFTFTNRGFMGGPGVAFQQLMPHGDGAVHHHSLALPLLPFGTRVRLPNLG